LTVAGTQDEQNSVVVVRNDPLRIVAQRDVTDLGLGPYAALLGRTDGLVVVSSCGIGPAPGPPRGPATFVGLDEHTLETVVRFTGSAPCSNFGAADGGIVYASLEAPADDLGARTATYAFDLRSGAVLAQRPPAREFVAGVVDEIPVVHRSDAVTGGSAYVGLDPRTLAELSRTDGTWSPADRVVDVRHGRLVRGVAESYPTGTTGLGTVEVIDPRTGAPAMSLRAQLDVAIGPDRWWQSVFVREPYQFVLQSAPAGSSDFRDVVEYTGLDGYRSGPQPIAVYPDRGGVWYVPSDGYASKLEIAFFRGP
jgi:hypothetical protein